MSDDTDDLIRGWMIGEVLSPLPGGCLLFIAAVLVITWAAVRLGS